MAQKIKWNGDIRAYPEFETAFTSRLKTAGLGWTIKAQDKVVAYPAQQIIASAAGTATQADIVIINHYHDKVENIIMIYLLK